MTALADTVDPEGEFLDLWTAPTADALHQVLVLHPPVRTMADAFEPFMLLKQHHEREPATSLTTAVLLLTDRRWHGGSSRLVAQIAESGILDDEQLDLLAEVFVAADDAVYWTCPDDWFAGSEVVIDLDDFSVVEDAEPVPVGPTVARREVFPPVRRWAAGHRLTREPASWPALRARCDELPARASAAVMAGILDRLDVLAPGAQARLVADGLTWPHHTVRGLALDYIAERDGADVAYRLARDDPNAKIRARAAALAAPAQPDRPDQSPAAAPGARRASGADQPALF